MLRKKCESILEYVLWIWDNFSYDLPIEQVKFDKKKKKKKEERGLNTIDDLINQIFDYRACAKPKERKRVNDGKSERKCDEWMGTCCTVI